MKGQVLNWQPTCYIQLIILPVFETEIFWIGGCRATAGLAWNFEQCNVALVHKECSYWLHIQLSCLCARESVSVHATYVESSWNLMAHGDAREGKWRGNWRVEWAASTLTLPRNMVYPALLPLMRTPRLPAVDWTDAPADLNGLVRFAERPNLVSARVPSHFKRTVPTLRHAIVRDAGQARAAHICLLCEFLLAVIDSVYGMLTVTYVTLIG
jgi:hypothetical protein